MVGGEDCKYGHPHLHKMLAVSYWEGDERTHTHWDWGHRGQRSGCMCWGSWRLSMFSRRFQYTGHQIMHAHTLGLGSSGSEVRVHVLGLMEVEHVQ